MSRRRQNRGETSFAPAKPISARRWFAILLTLVALVLQTFAPVIAARAAPPASDVERIAADLKATFGDTVQLCVQSDGGAPAPIHPAHANDCCLPCCAHANAYALVPPDLGLPSRANSPVLLSLAPPLQFAPPLPRPAQAQPRAPPFEV